jgi:hypothetical protein
MRVLMLLVCVSLSVPASAETLLVVGLDVGSDAVAAITTDSPLAATLHVGPHLGGRTGARPYLGLRFGYDWDNLATSDGDVDGGGGRGVLAASLGVDIDLIETPKKAGLALLLTPAVNLGVPIAVGADAEALEDVQLNLAFGGSLRLCPVYKLASRFGIGGYLGLGVAAHQLRHSEGKVVQTSGHFGAEIGVTLRFGL